LQRKKAGGDGVVTELNERGEMRAAVEMFEQCYESPERPEFAAAMVRDACENSPSFAAWYNAGLDAAAAVSKMSPEAYRALLAANEQEFQRAWKAAKAVTK
jgi:hypothetical protein